MQQLYQKFQLKNLKDMSSGTYDIEPKDLIAIDYERITNIPFTKDPDFYVASLEDVIIEPDTFTLKKDGSFCFKELYYHTLEKKLNIDSIGKHVFLPRKEKEQVFHHGEYLLLGGHNNYYHWFFNWFPRLVVYSKLAGFSECKIIVNEDLAPFQIESLKSVGVNDDQVIKIDSRWDNIFEHVYAAPIFDIPNHSFRAINFLRDSFMKIDMGFVGGRKIYISRNRSRARHVKNEDKVIDLLMKYGFEVWELDECSLKDQVELFRGVSHLITPHGAALTNMVFTNSDIHVIELQNETHHTNVYWNLSLACSSKTYDIVKCKDKSSVGAPYLRDMEVDLTALEAAVKKIC